MPARTPASSIVSPAKRPSNPTKAGGADQPQLTNAQLHAIEHQFSAPNYDPLPAVLATGNGVWVHDVEGKKYLDMLAGYSALSFGHQHPRIMDAFFTQAKRLTVVSRAFENDQLGLFCKELAEFCGWRDGEGQTLPMNTGAEAVETAIKTSRKWAYLKKGVPADKAEIICCIGNFHGRTTTVISMSAVAQYKDHFGPLTAGFKLIPFGDVEALKNAITPNTAAFIIEPIQGEGGINIPADGYLARCFEICRKNNVLFVADEVQTGFARTGKMFACDYDGVKPDLLVLGKALGGGVYPVSAVVGRRDVFEVFNAGDHGSTFGGNPLAAAVGREVLRVLRDEDLANRAAETGKWLRSRLSDVTAKGGKVKQVRGRGLLNGIELHKEAGDAYGYVKRLLKEGVLCKDTAKQVIRVTPPLIITRDECEWGLERIARALS
jgi:ornithine--oxo-acid transaminase